MMQNVKVDDTVYYVDTHENKVKSSSVLAVKEEIMNIEGPAAKLMDGVYTFYKPFNCLFSSEEEAENDRAKSHAAQVKAYCDQIHTTEDLLRFAVDHSISMADEFYDQAARDAYIRCADEICGVDLRESRMQDLESALNELQENVQSEDLSM